MLYYFFSEKTSLTRNKQRQNVVFLSETKFMQRNFSKTVVIAARGIVK